MRNHDLKRPQVLPGLVPVSGAKGFGGQPSERLTDSYWPTSAVLLGQRHEERAAEPRSDVGVRLPADQKG